VVPPTPPPAAEAAAPAPKAQAASGSRQAGTKPRLTPPKDRRRLAELIGGAVVVLLVVLFATGAIDLGGGDDSDDSDGSAAIEASANGSTKLTQAILRPVDGSDAEGLAVFARADKNGVRLLLQAEGLEPSGKDQAYAVSLARSAEERIPIAVTRVPQSGKVEAQYPIPSESLGLLANGFDQMELSLVSNLELQAALAQAGKEQKAPDYEGEDVLRGEVTGPIVNIAEEEGEN
ncbi:MAG TPA: hypothetical protein VF259_04115, partial [Solirubrobacterales bacterium]